MANTVPTEFQEAMALCKWSKYKRITLVHFANEGKRSWQTGKALKLIGMSKGFPDYGLLEKRGVYGGLFIELKRTKGSTVSFEQQLWIDKLNRDGYMASVCYGAEEAIKIIEKYVALPIYNI